MEADKHRHRVRLSTVAVTAAAALTAALLPAVAAQAATTPAAGVTIKLAHDSKCLNVTGASTADNATIVQYTCGAATATNDKFKLVPKGNELYWIQGIGSGKCLNVKGASTALKAPIVQYTCSSTALNNLWYVDEVPNKPTVRLVSANTGGCLNLPGASTADKVGIVQYQCSAGTTSLNEQFFLPPTGSPTAVRQPYTSKQPISVLQGTAATSGAEAPVYYSWVDSGNELNSFTDFDPDPNSTDPNAPAPVWIYIDGYTYAGRTYQGPLANGRVQIVGHDATTGDTNLMDEGTKGTADWGYLYDIGAASAAQPTVGPASTDGSLATWAVIGGALWYAPQTVNDAQAPYGAWRTLGGTGLAGTPTVVKTSTGVRVFALSTAGHLQTATFAAGTLSAWTDLGGSGLNGTLSVVAGPTGALSVFVRSGDGTIVTLKQNTDGTFPATWATIGDLVSAGSPTAVLNTYPGQIAVAARDAQGQIELAYETAAGSGVYGDWETVSDTSDAVAASDPTAFSYTVPSGPSFGIAFQSTSSDFPWVITFTSAKPAAGAAKADAAAKTAVPHHKIDKLSRPAKKKAGLTPSHKK